MLALTCLVVDDGSVVGVEIEAVEPVWKLKEVIQGKNTNSIKCDAKDLQLWNVEGLRVTRQKNVYTFHGEQLTFNDEFGEKVIPKEDDDEMVAGLPISDYFPKETQPVVGFIHVLVKLPESQPQEFVMCDWFASDLVENGQVQLGVDEFNAMKFGGKSCHMDETQTRSEDDDEETVNMNVKFQSFEISSSGPVVHPGLSTPIVFVRPCYAGILAALQVVIDKGENRNVIVTGNPGVGKSRFYLYCILRFASHLPKERKLIVNKEDDCYLVQHKNGQLQFASVNYRMMRSDRNVVRLVDAKSNYLLGWSGISILFTSPGAKKSDNSIKEYAKNEPLELVMPPWTLKELELARPIIASHVHAEDVAKRYESVGGIARFVFASDPIKYDEYLRTIEAVINSTSAKTLVSVVGQIFDPETYSHRILHMVPLNDIGRPYQGYYLDFSSNTMAERIFEILVEQSYEELNAFAVATSEDAITSTLRGRIYEMMCHRWFVNANSKQIEISNVLNKRSQISIQVPPNCQCVWFSSLDEITIPSATPTYYRLRFNNYPCVDALFWNKQVCYLLQMTISLNHPIVYQPLLDILKWISSKKVKVEFVFLIPRHHIEAFQLQQYTTARGRVYRRAKNKLVQNLGQHIACIDFLTKKRPRSIDGDTI